MDHIIWSTLYGLIIYFRIVSFGQTSLDVSTSVFKDYEDSDIEPIFTKGKFSNFSFLYVYFHVSESKISSKHATKFNKSNTHNAQAAGAIS